MLPTIDLCGERITRLLIGGNPFSGFSHQGPQLDNEMVSFYTCQRIKEAWDEAQRDGINAFCFRGDRHMWRVIREYSDEGKARMHWIAQTIPELADFQANIKSMANSKKRPLAIYYHGGQADMLWDEGKKNLLKDRLKYIRDQGVFVGLASHRPEVISRVEDEDWDVDFYLTSFYNLTRKEKDLTVISGSEGEKFDPNDPSKMCEVIRGVSKVCIAYKILGAGRSCRTRSDLHSAFSYALNHIKPTDAVLVGVFQKYGNQIVEDIQIVGDILSKK